jgi:sulfite reductase (ferredoxin)
MKYLVHTKGIGAFKALVESYLGKELEPWRPLVPWTYKDWLGWHETGDGTLFLGINIEQVKHRHRLSFFRAPSSDACRFQGRVKDAGEVKTKALLRVMADKGLDMVLTPSQSVLITGIKPEDKADLEAVVRSHGVKMVDEIDPLTRLSMACPAFPLCGLAIAEVRSSFAFEPTMWSTTNSTR